MQEWFVVGVLSVLVRLKIVTASDAVLIEKSFHDSDIDQFDHFLLSEGIIDAENLLLALSEYFQVPSFDVVGYFFERHYLQMFDKSMLLRNEIIPLEVDENIMIIVASKPDDPDILAEIGRYVSYDIRFYVGIGLDICDAVKEFYDKSYTEDFEEDETEEGVLFGEFHFLNDDEDKFE
jgi:hypothetical protein